MNEAQRQSALQAMGIESYYPRFILPGAAASVQADVSLDMFGLTQPSGSKASPAALLQALDEADTESRTKSPNRAERIPPAPEVPEPEALNKAPVRSEPASSAAAPVEGSESLRLKLVCICLADGLVIINELPLAAADRLTSRHLKLLSHLVYFLTGRRQGNGEAEGLSSMLFHWPMLNIPGVDNSPASARDALMAFIEEHNSGRTPEKILVMGAMVADKLFAESQGADSVKLARSYSLDQLLQLPSLKKQLWRDLKSFRR